MQSLEGSRNRINDLQFEPDDDEDSCSVTSSNICKSLIYDDFEPLASRLQRLHSYDPVSRIRRDFSRISSDRTSGLDCSFSDNGDVFGNVFIESPGTSHESGSSLRSELDIMAYNNSPPISPSVFPLSPYSTSFSSSTSVFSTSQQDAAAMVRRQDEIDDGLGTYLIQIKLRPLFSHDVIPGTSLRKLPRLINGIPLGAGFLSRDQLSGLKWRLIEGGHSTLTFISTPIKQDEAEESKTCFRETLMKQSQAVFGDMTIKASIMLTKCIKHDEDFIINDIAIHLEEGLQFRD